MSEKEDVEFGNAAKEVVAAMLDSFGIEMKADTLTKAVKKEEEREANK